MTALQTFIRWLPHRPREMHSVFAGTSTRRDGMRAISRAFSRTSDPDVLGEFSRMLGDATGCAPAALFGAGRMGLFAILEALELRPGDEIVLPGFTCAVVPNAMVYRGLTPVFVDIGLGDFNIDPAAVRKAITPRTRAIYAQHTFGVACDVGAIGAIAREHGLMVIEDLAHALGATVGGRPVGSFADASFGSTDRTKVINTQIGGWASSRRPEIAEKLRRIAAAAPSLSGADQRRAALALGAECLWRDPSLLWIGRPVLGVLRRLGLDFVWQDEGMDQKPVWPPYPCRFPETLAGAGVDQMLRLNANLTHRRAIARWLDSRIGRYADMGPRWIDEQAWLRYSLLVRDRASFIDRFGARIDLGTWFTEPIFGRPATADAVGYRAGSCPNAEYAATHIVNFPTHPRISMAFLDARFKEHGEWLRDQVVRV
jgi:dTDP-4-amino-4,6-dideoxygalactose transaminase